jgi:hypothetical protein
MSSAPTPARDYQPASTPNRRKQNDDRAEVTWLLIICVAPFILGATLGATLGPLLFPSLPVCEGEGSVSSPYVVSESGCTVPDRGQFYMRSATPPQIDYPQEVSDEP